MQPLHYDLRCPAAKDNSITHAAVAPSNLDAAITMRSATSGCKPASLDAHGNTKRQQSCSRYTAICDQRVHKRKELRTHEQPRVAEHRGGTDRARFERSRTRRTHTHTLTHTRGTFHRRPEPLHTEKHKVSCPGFLPKRSPCNTSMQPLQCVLQHQVADPHLSTHMATQNDNNHAAGRSHFTRKDTQFPAAAFSQNEAHATSTQPLNIPFCNIRLHDLHLPTHMATQNDNNHVAITLRSATRESTNANHAHMNNHSLQNTEEEPIAPGSSAAAPVAHTRYLSSPAGATLHGKTEGFLPRLSPKTKPMQHPCSHYNAFCNIRLQARISRRTWQHKTTTTMQPLHCDLQPCVNSHTTIHSV